MRQPSHLGKSSGLWLARKERKEDMETHPPKDMHPFGMGKRFNGHAAIYTFNFWQREICQRPSVTMLFTTVEHFRQVQQEFLNLNGILAGQSPHGTIELTNKSRTIRRTITSGLKSTVRGLQKDAIEMNNGEVNLESTSRRKHPEMVGLDEIWWFSVDLEGSQSNEQGILTTILATREDVYAVCASCDQCLIFPLSIKVCFFIESTKKNMNNDYHSVELLHRCF